MSATLTNGAFPVAVGIHECEAVREPSFGFSKEACATDPRNFIENTSRRLTLTLLPSHTNPPPGPGTPPPPSNVNWTSDIVFLSAFGEKKGGGCARREGSERGDAEQDTGMPPKREIAVSAPPSFPPSAMRLRAWAPALGFPDCDAVDGVGSDVPARGGMRGSRETRAGNGGMNTPDIAPTRSTAAPWLRCGRASWNDARQAGRSAKECARIQRVEIGRRFSLPLGYCRCGVPFGESFDREKEYICEYARASIPEKNRHDLYHYSYAQISPGGDPLEAEKAAT
jgi:hypothetical protein